MRSSPVVHARHIQIRNEYDVVAMRQEVRQVARDLGLGLSQQAKIATAISTVARALIAANCSATMGMRLDDQASRPMLEIICQMDVGHLSVDLAQLEQLLSFSEARALVDEASLALDSGSATLCLRMSLIR
jgi:ABC-type ATPase involved in cell division